MLQSQRHTCHLQSHFFLNVRLSDCRRYTRFPPPWFWDTPGRDTALQTVVCAYLSTFKARYHFLQRAHIPSPNAPGPVPCASRSARIVCADTFVLSSWETQVGIGPHSTRPHLGCLHVFCGYCDQCCYDHKGTCIFLNYIFVQVYAQQWDCWKNGNSTLGF